MGLGAFVGKFSLKLRIENFYKGFLPPYKWSFFSPANCFSPKMNFTSWCFIAWPIFNLHREGIHVTGSCKDLYVREINTLGRPHHYLAPLPIFLCWTFLFFLFSPGSLCVGHLGFFCPRWVGTTNTSPPSPHTTMGSDTSCWGDKHLGELPWIINITYRDTL